MAFSDNGRSFTAVVLQKMCHANPAPEPANDGKDAFSTLSDFLIKKIIS